jgi:glycosyltransferase involved in cell wall biosynthesis
MTSISEELAHHADVHVLCGPNGYGGISGSNEKLKNITIHRLNAFNFDKNNILLRILRLIFLSFGMFFFSLFKVKKTDKLLLVTNPALSIPLFAVLKWFKKFSFFILVHDVFPENLIPGGVIKSASNPLYKTLKSIFNWSYKKADKLFVLGRDMFDIMASKTNYPGKITVIENWADITNVTPEDFSNNLIIIEEGLKDKIVFLFAGNIGRLQGLEFIFELLKEIKNSKIHFLFVGNGAMLPVLEKKKRELNLRNLSFLGTYPRDKQQLFLNASHFGVVTLEQSFYGLGVPSKSYNILAAGKPIFFIGNPNSEISLLINETGCGVAYSQTEKENILNFLDSLTLENLKVYQEFGLKGRSLVEKKFSKKIILKKFTKELINDL